MTRNPWRNTSLAALAAFALACGTPGVEEPTLRPAPKDALIQAIQEGLDAAAELSRATPPPEVSEELLPPAQIVSPGPAGFQQRFDVAVKDVSARDFFMGLVEGTPHNMVLDPSVNGEITLSLKNVSIEDVMNAASDIYGYEYRKTAYGYHVLPTGLQTRTFQVNYLNVHRSGHSQTRVSSGQVSENAHSRGSGLSEGGALTGGGGGMVSGSRIATQTDANFWSELESSLKAILGTAEGRAVVASPNTGIVIVRATAAELREVQSYLESAEETMARQVILEAKILEVTLSDGFQSGINWASLTKFGSRNDPYSILMGQTGGGSSLGDGASENLGETFVLNPDAQDLIETTNASAFGGVFSMVLNFQDFAAIIELLETQGNVRTLSSPRISTVNNQKAVIKVGTDEFFVTDVSTTTVSGAATTTSPDIELTPFFSGIALDVTPQISEAGDIVLHIHPSVSEVTDQTKIISIGDVDQTIPLARSTIRESDSVVRAHNRQVIVIGGLMKDLATDHRAATPWINRIPMLGKLFRHQRDLSQKTELVILLRPHVVDDGAWQETLEGVMERMERLQRPLGFRYDNPKVPEARDAGSE
jgi:MSHA biogenesis protein MshL